jgi:hypothetical protein
MSTCSFLRTPLIGAAALLVGLIVALLSDNVASAAVITISAGPIETIYSQTNTSGIGSVTVNILPSATIFNSTYLNLTSDAMIDQLFLLGPDNDASKIIDAFFVDNISFCGKASPDIVGCANRPGHDLVVKSSYAATDTKELDLSHEIGHNLGLPHVTSCANCNLMNPVLGSTVLTDAQFASILTSPLFQPDPNADNGYFMDIRPILVAPTVPLPPAWIMMIGGLGVVGFLRLRRASRTAPALA